MENKDFHYPVVPTFEFKPYESEIPDDVVFADSEQVEISAEIRDMLREVEIKNEIENRKSRRLSIVALAVAVLSLFVGALSLTVAIFQLKLSFSV